MTEADSLRDCQELHEKAECELRACRELIGKLYSELAAFKIELAHAEAKLDDSATR